MKVKLRLIDVLMASVKKKNLPSKYLQKAEEIERSLRMGKWRIVKVGS
jgi:hypothetical protein